MILQLDVGWVNFAGLKPEGFVRKYPGRTVTTHYKAKLAPNVTGKRPIIGEDSIDWLALIDANLDVGGTKWLIVEQEDYPEPLSPLESVRLSKQGLDRFLEKLP